MVRLLWRVSFALVHKMKGPCCSVPKNVKGRMHSACCRMEGACCRMEGNKKCANEKSNCWWCTHPYYMWPSSGGEVLGGLLFTFLYMRLCTIWNKGI